MTSQTQFKRKKVRDRDKSDEPEDTLGLRECVKPSSSAKPIDIVFVHGLTGGNVKTWTHKPSLCFWPQDLLPSNLPGARIFTYGYDADVVHFVSQTSQSRIGNHARTFLNALALRREQTETSDRPLLFVAHSLGGLVVEDMLFKAKNSFESYHQKILESTAGIIFMGTPHCGSKLADWAKICTSVAKVVKGANKSIVSVLQPDSEVLALIQQDFHTMIRSRSAAGKPQIRITCFYEDHDIVGVGAVVPKHSAILSGYNEMSIPADHLGMTKFSSPEDVGYERVSGELWFWTRDIYIQAQDAPPVADSASSATVPTSNNRLLTERGQTNTGPAMYFNGSMNNVGNLYQGSFGDMTFGRS